MNYTRIYSIANLTIALSWFYHGLVPKLLHMETGELEMMMASGMFKGYEASMVNLFGVGEILFGLAFLFWGKSNVVHYLNIAGLVILGTAALLIKPGVYIYPFNTATTSIGMIALSLIILTLNKKAFIRE